MVWERLRESTSISCTVVIVPESSGTLTLRLLDIEPERCQKGSVSVGTAVSLSDVAERPADKAASLSEGDPTGLLAVGHS